MPDPFDLAVILAGWIGILRASMFRTLRAVVTLGVLSAVLLLASALLLGVPAAATKILIVCTYLILVVRLDWMLASLSRREFAFDNRLRLLAKGVREAAREWVRTGSLASRERMADRARQAVDELDTMVAPSPDWERSRQVIREYIVSYVSLGAGRASPQETFEVEPSGWRRVLDELQRVETMHASFWR